MNAKIVLGLLWGDEGKGMVTDWLCSKSKNSLVVRFSGGHQAGHTVAHGLKRHVFSHFGSGTFHGAPTFWSKYCTFYPTGLVREYNALREMDVSPKIYIDPMSPVTTFYDVLWNQHQEMKRGDMRHGSCGVGFGATIARNETPYKLHAQDIFYPVILKQKLQAISEYYKSMGFSADGDHPGLNFKVAENVFMEAIEECKKIVTIISEVILGNYEDVIFEGSQGILLDMDFGIFPNVTRSNVTSKNAFEMMERNGHFYPSVYYVTRAYQTRHGNGFMTNEGYVSNWDGYSNETNKLNAWQGEFRKGNLDFDMINYALQCDSNFCHNAYKNIVVTCGDQINGDIIATSEGKKVIVVDMEDFMRHIKLELRPHYIFTNTSCHAGSIKQYQAKRSLDTYLAEEK